MVDVVTRQHARAFVVELIPRVMETEIISDAFSKTEIMTWPDDGAAQERYDDIMQEIVEKTFATAKATMIDAFVAAATEVLARERLPMTTKPSHVEMVAGVTREHAAKFAEDWYTHTINRSMTDPFDEAFGATGILKWPEGDDDEITPAQRRFDAMQREIVETTCAVLKLGAQ
jgi:hypothetical protein